MTQDIRQEQKEETVALDGPAVNGTKIAAGTGEIRESHKKIIIL